MHWSWRESGVKILLLLTAHTATKTLHSQKIIGIRERRKKKKGKKGRGRKKGRKGREGRKEREERKNPEKGQMYTHRQ